MRVVLLVSIAILGGAQFIATAITPGDHHREAAQWVAHHADDEVVVFPVILAINRTALRREGWNGTPAGELYSRERNIPRIADSILKLWGPSNKGLMLIYCSRLPAEKALRSLEKQGAIAGFRHWDIYSEVKIMAFARTEAELAWLDALPQPELRMGAARERTRKSAKGER